MSQAIIIYETRTGNTRIIAEAIQEGMKKAGVEVLLKRTAETKADDMADVAAVILGAPTYHHDLISSMKTFLFEMSPNNGRYHEAYLRNGGDGTRIENKTQAN